MITFKKFAFGRSGFGNQLFQYAGARLYAELNNFGNYFPDWIGSKIFSDIKLNNNIKKIDTFRYYFLPTRQLSDLKSYNYWQSIKWFLCPRYFRLPPTISLENLYNNPEDHIDLYGYFQDKFSFALLKKYKHLVLEWFAFKKEIDESLYKLTEKFRPWIGLHIRRGDFVKLGLDLPMEQYKESLNKIYNNENIFIASNDESIKKDFSGFKIIDYKNPLSDISDYVFDFWMLKNAQTVIGGGSTFSWWAAYLGNNNYYSLPLLRSEKMLLKEQKISKQEV